MNSPVSSVTVGAVDLGAGSGRVMLARAGPDRLELEEVARFPNRPVRLPSGLHWDVLGLYSSVLDGLAEALRRAPDLAAVGIDSWAVDYGLLRHGRLLGTPYHYRDARNVPAAAAAESRVPFAAQFARNGLQRLPFTTINQLTADRIDGLLEHADEALLLPDLLAFWLTGERLAERTNASTTGLLGALSREWDTALASRLGLPARILPRLVDPGDAVGHVRPEAAERIGWPAARDPLPVVAVGSHDTASAVVAVPMGDPTRSAYVSSGTWSLVGVELGQPVLTDAARDASFTNELGVDGRVRFLHNVMGLWLLDESVRTWRASGADVDLAALLAEADAVDPSRVPVFDADDERFLPGGDVPSLIDDVCARTGQAPPRTPGEYVRAILESLAAAYARVIADAERVTGRTVEVVHVVGGGARNELLCRLTARSTGRTVLAGPVEATALGNALVQARALGACGPGLADLRALVARTHPVQTYLPD